MALSSSSTLAEVQAAYDDNANYDVEGSVTQCGTFIHASRILLRRLADQVQRGDHLMRQECRRTELALKRAEDWLDKHQAVPAGAVGRDRFVRVRGL